MKTLLYRLGPGSRCVLGLLCATLIGWSAVEGFLVSHSVRLCGASNSKVLASCRSQRVRPFCSNARVYMELPGASNSQFDIQISTVMGIEAVTKRELEDLGYPDSLARNGRVEFRAGAEAIARCNINLRSATRVLIKLGEFEAATFDELFDGVYAIPWGDVIHAGAAFPVRGKSVRSQLHSVPACQSIVKKAITKKLLTLRGQDPNHDDSWLEEDERRGVCQIEVALLKDVVTISLDTSGDALAKRGYRPGILQGGAPLKETLAASMLLLSRWTPDRPLYDPFCGSGTILLEAALMAKRIAPGLRRTFAAEDCPLVCERSVWKAAFDEAEAAVLRGAGGGGGLIFGSDIDQRAVDMTYEHLSAAGLDSLVQLSVADVHKVPMPPGDYGCVVTNPPYGERLDDSQRANQGLRRLMEGLDTWSLFALSGDDYLEADVGKRASKRRKLYNGKLPCQLYQYFGPLPPRERRSDARDAEAEEAEGAGCGACCFLGADEPDLQALSDPDERAMYKSMIAPSGWCKHFDTEARSCTIYDTRPRFCRTEPEVFEELFEVPKEEFVDAAIGSCLDAISHLYGDDSQEFERYQQCLDDAIDE